MSKNNKSGFNITSMLNPNSLSQSNQTRKKINYKQLVAHEKNHYSLEGIEELADSIQDVGLLHDIIVKPTGETSEDGKKLYVVVSGHRRMLAMINLVEERGIEKYAEIPCVILPQDEDETITELKLHFANVTTREMSEYDKMVSINEMRRLINEAKDKGLKIKGRVKEIVAENIGLKPTQAQKYMTVFDNSTDEVKEAIKKGEITIETAHALIKENKAKAEEVVSNVVETENMPDEADVEVEKRVEEKPKPKLDMEQVKNIKKETPKEKAYKKLTAFEKSIDRMATELEDYEEIKAMIKKISQSLDD